MTSVKISIDPNYLRLQEVLWEAYDQAASGKGQERHSSGEAFQDQPICQITRSVGLGYPLGQAIKKILESQRLPKEQAVKELFGAINYLAGAVIVRREKD